MLRGLAAIIPTFNEASNLPRLLPRVAHSLASCAESYEIVVVDDDSPDLTADIAREIRRKTGLPIRVYVREDERDLSSAVVFGAKKASYDNVVVLDADFSHDPRDIPRLAAPLCEYPLCVGSRYATGGEIRHWPIARRLCSRLGTLPARWLTRVSDPLSGFFASRTELLEDERLRPRGYKILLELLGRHSGLRVKEVPIHFTDRQSGESKFGPRQGAEFLVQLTRLTVNHLCQRITQVSYTAASTRGGCTPEFAPRIRKTGEQE